MKSYGSTGFNKLEQLSRKEEEQRLISHINSKQQRYRVSETLYVGKSSFVFLLQCTQIPQQGKKTEKIVIKTISKYINKADKSEKTNDKKLKKIRNQISMQKNLKSNYVVDLIDSDQQSNYFFVKMKQAQEGSLANYLMSKAVRQNNKQKSQFDRKIYLALQLVTCIKHLHSNRVVHRDLKPQNILLDSEFSPKICDFGLALKLGQNQKISGIKGTLNYIAPQSRGLYDQRVDIWAYGCILYQLVMGKNIFSIKLRQNLHQNFDEINIARQIHKVQQRFKNPDLTDLFQKIFKTNPDQRISIDEIIGHPFFNLHQLIGQSSSQSSDSSNKFHNICNTEPQPTLSRTKSFMKLQVRQVNKKTIQQISKNSQNDQNNINLLNTRISKLFSYQNSQKSSNTSLCSLRSQRYQKIAARRQNLSKEMQKSQAFLIQQNRPLMKKKVLSPIKIGKMKPIQYNTLCGKIKITKGGIIKQASSLCNSAQKNIQLHISSDGKNIVILRGKKNEHYDLESLPQKYHNIYQYCKDTIKMIKSTTVKIRIEIPESFEIRLMESGAIQVQIKGHKYNSFEDVPLQINQKELMNNFVEFLKSAHSE